MKVTSLSDYKHKKVMEKLNLPTDNITDTYEGRDFVERMRRIRRSMEKINNLMGELKDEET